MRECPARLFAAASLMSVLSVSALRAQAGLPLLGDASTPPKGMLRLHAATAWSRADARFRAGGVEPLGAMFSADSLGVRQIPRLAVAESLVREASGVPFALTLGRSRLDATAREEIIPLTLEYGVTRRLAIGVMMPIVRRRLAVQFRLDTAGGFAANVGPNQHRTNPVAAQNNATVAAQFAGAAQQLQARLASCQADPAAAGCAALLARQAEAQTLITTSTAFAADLEQIYGSASGTGQPFVPTATSDAHLAIEARIAAFDAQYRDLLSASTSLLTALPFGAGGPAGVADLRGYFASQEGARDSIATQERVGIGDVEVGVKVLAIDRPATTNTAVGMQLALAAAYRFSSGSTHSPSEIADLRVGAGRDALDVRALLDVARGRLGLFASGRFELGIPAAEATLPFDPYAFRTDERVVEVSAAPRWHLSPPLSFHLAWSLRSGNILGTDQLAGGGVSFSGFRATPAGKTPPVEMRFTHLESVSGDAGRPRFFRDQVELRIYYRLRR